MTKLTPLELLEKFKATTRGKALFAKYPPTTLGIWAVDGEGDEIRTTRDADLLEGEFQHVVAYAVTQPYFWSYGTGGDFRKLEPRKVDGNSVEMQQNLLARKAALAVELEAINAALGTK